jgi:hypothetical protein
MPADGKRPQKADDTRRQRAIRACRRHLKDLRAAYGRPPPDVVVRSVAVPKRIAPVEPCSYCSSPAELCAEIMK